MENLENAYKKMIQNDVPDLWERIDAGLTAKIQNTSETAKIITEKGKEQKTKRKPSRIKRFYKYSGIAAACICGILIIPAVISTLQSSKSGTDQSPMADAFEAASPEDFSDGEQWAGAEEDNGISEMNGESNSDNLIDNMDNLSEAANNIDDGANTPPNGLDYIDNDENTQSNDADISEDITIIENITVKILKVTELQYHRVYLARVEQDESGSFDNQEEITFLSDDFSLDILQMGESYRITLLYDKQASISYRLFSQAE